MSLQTRPGFLTPAEMEAVHNAALRILSEKGVVFESEEAVALLTEHGARADGKIVYLPAELVAKSLAGLPDRFRVHAADPAKSVTVGEGLIIHPCGGEVFLRDADGTRRDNPTMADYRDLQKLYQALPEIAMTGYQPLTPADVDTGERGLRCLYEAMLWTDKPWLAPMDYTDGAEKRRLLRLLERFWGADFMRDKYVTWSIVCPESPLVFSRTTCETILAFADFNQPVCIVSAPMSGITAPFSVAGILVLAVAETLAGIVLCQCARPGLPVLPSASLTAGNLKRATWECASPDTALMLGGAVQMFKEFYHLPARAQTGVTSAKCPDYQAGAETMQSLLLMALMDVNVTSQSAGSLDNLMTISFAKTVADNELIARARHIAAGFPVNEETLDVDTILEIEHGRDFLMADSTLLHYREGWQPSVSDWGSFEQWSADGEPDVIARAERKVRDILDAAQTPLLPADTARDLARFMEEEL